MTAHEAIQKRFMKWEEMLLHHGYDAVPVVCIGMDRKGHVILLVPEDMTDAREVAEQMIIVSAFEIAHNRAV